jgi:hypothetical protein
LRDAPAIGFDTVPTRRAAETFIGLLGDEIENLPMA